jgi:peptidoglycan/LPS O-acetylase OafA/YrhL
LTTVNADRHLDYLDGWRGLAILFLLLGHFVFDKAIPGFSVFGVDLFFVLSGRLMADILFIRNASLPTFFVRRFSRIYPALLVFVSVTTVVWAGSEYAHGLLAVATAMTFTINYAMVISHQVALLDHLWSLCVEEHGYVMLAVLAFFVRRRARLAALIMLGAGLAACVNGIVSRTVFDMGYAETHWRTDVAVAPIFIACALYILVRTSRIELPLWLCPLSFAMAVGMKFGVPAAWGYNIEPVFLALSVVTVDRTYASLTALLSSRVMGRIGLFSYSIYLWQQPFYKMSEDWSHHFAGPLMLAGIVCGVGSFYLVERPARRLINGAWEWPRTRML